MVDDDDLLRRATVRFLHATDVVGVVEDFHSPREALARGTNAPFHVAILDLHMPGMDGVELAERLCRLPPAPAIIFVTGSPDTEAADRARALAPLGILAKPWNGVALVALLRRAAAVWSAVHRRCPSRTDDPDDQLRR